MIAKLAILLVVAVTTATVSASRPEATDMSSLDSADNIVSKNGGKIVAYRYAHYYLTISEVDETS